MTQIVITEDGERMIGLDPVSVSADKKGNRDGRLEIGRFLRHAGIASRSTTSIILFGCYAEVNGDAHPKYVAAGDAVNVRIATDSLLRLLKLPPDVAAVAQVGDTLAIPVVA